MGWTNEQLAAINHRKGNLLVSASAGSGKTAVLSERVYQILTEGAKLNSLLVLTFTNYAAQEMRDRIRQKLIDGGYPEIAANVDAVNFQTYDAFAFSLVKKYHKDINVPNDVKIVDNTLIEIEKKKAIRRILDRKYEEEKQDVIKLVNKYCLKNDNKIVDLVITLYNKAQLKHDSKAFLDNFVSNYYDRKKLESTLNQIYSNFDNFVASVINSIGDPDYVTVGKFMQKVREYLLEIQSRQTFEEKAAFIQANPYPSASGARYEEGEKDLNHHIKDELVIYYFPFFKYNSKEEIYTRLESVKSFAQTIISLVKELSDELDIYKVKYNIYTFQDIFKLAIDVVSIPHIRAKLKKQFKYIMIDEYQDTSDLQELFINLIANDNVFAVGDVKQSIYKFRNANCELFQHKFEQYELGNGGELIILPDNFRSRGEVIDDINHLFGALMTNENADIDYEHAHWMNNGNLTYKKYVDERENYHTECIDYVKDDIPNNMTSAEYEARLIANDIIRRYNAKTKVMRAYKDENGKTQFKLDDIKFSDFAILIYAKTNFALYQKVFNEYQIPLYANYTQTIKDNNLTMAIKNLFKLISMARQDDTSHAFKHPFASVLRSFLVREEDDKIDAYFDNQMKEQDFPLFDKVKELADFSINHSLEELTKKIFDDFDVYDKCITVGDVSDNIELTNYFVKIAKEMDEMNYSVEDYVQYYDELDEFEIEPEYNGGAPAIDSVKLMSIHSSKGLQFKYVYYAKLDANFKHDATGAFLFDDVYGLDLPDTKYQNIDGLFHKFITRRAKKETILEQLRVFYVALTRAEEKAILINRLDFRKEMKEYFFDSNMYLDFLYISQIPFASYKVIDSEDRPNITKAIDKNEKVEIKDSYKFSPERYEISHASKEKSEDANNEALLLGTKYHYYLELVNFETKDTSFIIDEKDKKRIDKFLSNPLFDNAKNAKIAHEYSFYDEVNDIHGVIDLLMVYDDHIDIVDFKLSHVDDAAYKKQVSVYKDYISQISNGRDINLYILGILSGDMKKVC